MSIWYYADRNRQRQGPIEAAELAALFRRNEVAADTLVWREGLTQWQALGDFAGELGLLDDAPAPTLQAAPAPAAGQAPAPDEAAPAFAVDEPAAATADYVQPATPYAAPAASLAAHAGPFHGGEVVHAGFWKRFAASSIDNLLLTVVSWLIAAVLVAATGIGLGQFGNDIATGRIGALGPVLLIGIYVVPIVIQAIYFTWMHASGNQASLGKMAVGIKVTDTRGNPVSTGVSFGRWAGFFFFNLLSCGIATLVSAFMAGLTQRKQALHDMAAGTLVVDKWAFTDHPEWQRRQLGTVTIVVIALTALLAILYVVFIVAMVAALPRNA